MLTVWCRGCRGGGEEQRPFGLVVVGGVLALAEDDWRELLVGFEEAAAFTDRFVDAAEHGWPVAVSVAEVSPVIGRRPGRAAR